MNRRPSALDDDDLSPVLDDDGDVTSEDDPCGRCGERRGDHVEGEGCVFVEVT